MTIQNSEFKGKPLLTLSGGFVATGDRELLMQVSQILDQGHKQVILDLSGVDFIDSGGLGELVQLTARATTRGAQVVLANPSVFVAEVLSRTRLDRVFDIAPTVDAAAERGKPGI